MLYDKLVELRREELRRMASTIYEPNELDAWMTMSQPMAGGITPEQACHNGPAYDRLKAGLQALLDGAYL